MSNEIFFSDSAGLLPFTSAPTRPVYQKPSDILDVAPTAPYTIWYLSIIKPHTDTHDIIGPVRSFRHLLPRIEEIVSNSPRAIDKLAALKESEDIWGEVERNEDFFRDGFATFVVEGQRGSYTVLEVSREVNKEVFEVLPAPVYTVVSAGPLGHAAIAFKTSSSSSSSSSAKKSSRKKGMVEPGKPKGYASTTCLHGSYVDRAAAKEHAKYIMTVLLLDEDNVKEIGRWEKGSKGGGVLMGMNAETMWEVKVVYVDDPIGRAQEEADRGKDVMIW
jgi:hypothetical protein